jgi:uncharacterized oxidoreductase
MPTFTPDQLRELGRRLFTAAGCRDEDARVVAEHLVAANLAGHDSHGAMRIYEYLRFLRADVFRADGEPRVVRDAGCAAVVDGGGALGPVGGSFAAALAIRKAREHGVGVVTLRNCAHLGRIGTYPLQAAQAGMLGLAFVNAGRLGYQIAPFGGIDGRLSTNPIAFAAPRRDADPILVDMTTSVVAEGKIRLAINQGRPVPEGWIIDAEGRPTTDPRALKADPPGAILPLGGATAGHKGYGLGFAVELLAGTLSGAGCAAGEREMKSNGLLLNVYRLDAFTDPETYYDELEALIRHVRGSRLAPGFAEILIPGEPEARARRRREAEGIPVDDGTWAQIVAEAALVGVDAEAGVRAAVERGEA